MFGFHVAPVQRFVGFGLEKTSDTNVEPISLAEAKAHCRIDFNDDDALLQGLITAARQRAEQVTGLCLTQQEWTLTLDNFPQRGSGDLCIRIPRAPVTAVNSITFADPFGTIETLDPSLYEADLRSLPVRIAPTFGNRYPSARPGVAKVAIQFNAGYAPADVPQTVKQAMLLMLSSWYDQRSDVVIDGGNVQQVPRGAEFLLTLSKVSVVGFAVA